MRSLEFVSWSAVNTVLQDLLQDISWSAVNTVLQDMLQDISWSAVKMVAYMKCLIFAYMANTKFFICFSFLKFWIFLWLKYVLQILFSTYLFIFFNLIFSKNIYKISFKNNECQGPQISTRTQFTCTLTISIMTRTLFICTLTICIMTRTLFTCTLTIRILTRFFIYLYSHDVTHHFVRGAMDQKTKSHNIFSTSNRTVWESDQYACKLFKFGTSFFSLALHIALFRKMSLLHSKHAHSNRSSVINWLRVFLWKFNILCCTVMLSAFF